MIQLVQSLHAMRECGGRSIVALVADRDTADVIHTRRAVFEDIERIRTRSPELFSTNTTVYRSKNHRCTSSGVTVLLDQA